MQELRDDRVGEAVKAGHWPEAIRRADRLLDQLPDDRCRLDAVLDLVDVDPILFDAAATRLTAALIIDSHLDLHEARWVLLRFSEYEEAHRRGGIRDRNVEDALRRHFDRRAAAAFGESVTQPPR